MFFPALCALLPLLASALYTPRSPALRARHAAILNARAPAPLPAPLPAPAPLVKIGKRSSKKCRPRPTSSSPPAPSHAPQNPGQDPAQSSSQQPQPTQPPPTHTSHKPSPTHTSHSPAPTQPSGGNDPFGDFFAGTQIGELTFYELGLTACGQTYSDSDYVAAVSHSLFDIVPGANGNPNDNPICGHKVRVTYQGNTIEVRIVDRCTGCAPTDLDLSPKAFSALAPQSLGRLLGAKWEWAS